MELCCHVGCLETKISSSAQFQWYEIISSNYFFISSSPKSALGKTSLILRCEGWFDVCWIQWKSKLIFLRRKTTIRLASWFCIIEVVFYFKTLIASLRQNCIFLICRNSCICAQDIQSSNIIIFCFFLFAVILECAYCPSFKVIIVSSLFLVKELCFLLVLKQRKYFNAPILKCLVRQMGACSPALVVQNINDTESCISFHWSYTLALTLIFWQFVMFPSWWHWNNWEDYLYSEFPINLMWQCLNSSFSVANRFCVCFEA